MTTAAYKAQVYVSLDDVTYYEVDGINSWDTKEGVNVLDVSEFKTTADGGGITRTGGKQKAMGVRNSNVHLGGFYEHLETYNQGQSMVRICHSTRALMWVKVLYVGKDAVTTGTKMRGWVNKFSHKANVNGAGAFDFTLTSTQAATPIA